MVDDLMAIRKRYTNSAPQLQLLSGVDDAATALSVASTSGYPDVPFTLTIGRSTLEQEVVLCTGKTSTTFTVTRGYDGTTAVSHAAGAVVEHTTCAEDYDGANSIAVNGAGIEPGLYWMGV